MSGIFKKAMNLFVEFEEEQENSTTQKSSSSSTPSPAKTEFTSQSMNAEELDKFEKHFEKMFEQANLPGPDYYEFWKMMETLEAHIKDEKARISATFASLAIQGMTKQTLVESAAKYKELISLDKAKFEKLASDKGDKDIGIKKKELQSLEELIVKHSEMIQRLTKEITDSQISIGKLKGAINEEETRLARNKHGYTLASEAMMRKISDDINKIQTTL